MNDLTLIDHSFPTKTMVREFYDGTNEEVEVPIVDHLDARALQAIEHEADACGKISDAFDMEVYNASSHSCGTPHCLAGWYIVLCGVQGQRLLKQLYASERAATMIFKASCPGQTVPSFDPCPTGSDGKSDWGALQLDLLRGRAAADPLPA